MDNKLNIRFGQKCFCFSFEDKEIGEVIKKEFYFSDTSQEPDMFYQFGYAEDNRCQTEKMEVLKFEGEKIYYNKIDEKAVRVLLPKKKQGTEILFMFPFLLDGFYRNGNINGEKGNDFIIHAAGLVKNGKGFIFTGKSGTGKTTVSELSMPEAELLSDEMIIVERSGEKYRMSGFPYKTGITNNNSNIVNLHAIFILVQDTVNSLRRLNGNNAGFRLVENTVYRDLFSESRWLDSVVDKWRIIDSINKHVPVYELRFRKDKSFWNEIDKLGYDS